MHRINAQLPPAVQAGLAAEAAAFVSRIQAAIAQLTAEPNSPDTTERLELDIIDYLDLKHSLPDATRCEWSGSLLKLALAPEVGMLQQAQYFEALDRLLKARWISRGLLQLKIDWHQLYDLLTRTYFHTDLVTPLCGAHIMKKHKAAVIGFISTARKFFSAESADELFQTILPQLRNVDNLLAFKAQGELALLLPGKLALKHEHITASLEIWAKVDHCPDWECNWFTIMARISNSTPSFDWQPHVPFMLSRVQRLFNLPCGKHGRPQHRGLPGELSVLWAGKSKRRYHPAAKKSAKLIVSLLGGAANEEGKVSSTMVELRRLISSCATFFHPSSHGDWSSVLGAFIGNICAYTAKRKGRASAVEEASCAMQMPMPQEEEEAVVRLVLPLVRQGLYSKDEAVVHMMQDCLRHLCSVSPVTVMNHIVPRLYLALGPTNVNCTHQMPSAIGALDSLLQPLLQPRPLIAPQLAQILQLTLAGIDANNPKKTMITLSFALTVFKCLAIADASDEGCSPPGDAELALLPPLPPYYKHRTSEEGGGGIGAESAKELYVECWRASSSVAIYAMELLDRMLQVVVFYAEKQATGLSQIMKYVSSYIEFTAVTLLTQLSPALQKKALGKIAAWVGNLFMPDGAKLIAKFIGAITLALPGPSLDLLVPQVMSKLMDKKGGIDAGLSQKEIVWQLRILDGAVRKSGVAALAHEPKLNAVLALTLQHSEHKKVRKAASKLLRHLLKALLTTYPTESRSLPATTEVPAFMQWGRDAEWKDAAVQWHVPSAEEVRMAAALTKKWLLAPMGEVDEAMTKTAADGDTAMAEDGEQQKQIMVWRQRLKLIRHALRGILTAMPDNSTAATAVNESGIYGVNVSVDIHAEAAVFVGLRHKMLTFSTKLLQHMDGEGGKAAGFENEIKCKTLVLKMAKLLLTSRGGRPSKTIHSVHNFHAHTKRGQAQTASQYYRLEVERKKLLAAGAGAGAGASDGIRPMLRNAIVKRAHIQLERRSALAARRALRNAKETGQAGVALDSYSQLVAQLLGYSGSMYAEVRKEAQGVVGHVWGRMPWLLPELVPSMARRLSEGGEGVSDDAATGNLFILFQNAPLRFLSNLSSGAANNGANGANGASFGYAQLVSCLCSSGKLVSAITPDRQSKLQNRIYHLFVKLCEQWHSQVLQVGQTESMELLVKLLQPAEAAAKDDAADGENLNKHWRYRLMMLAWLLRILPKPNSSAAPWANAELELGVWRVFMKAIGDESQPLQKLGLLGLQSMLQLAGPGGGDGMDVDAGAGAVPAAICDEMQAATFVEKLLEALKDDHGGGGAKRGGGDDGAWSFGVKEVLGAVQVWDEGIPYPLSRSGRSAATFAPEHARLVELLLRRLGSGGALLATMKPLLETMVADETDERANKHSTVAEVVAGAMRSVARPSDDSSRATAFVDFVEPLLNMTLEKATLDSCADWVDSFRFAVHEDSIDGGTVMSLSLGYIESMSKIVVTNLNAVLAPVAFPAVGKDGKEKADDNYSMQSKWLRLLHALLVELTSTSAGALHAVGIMTTAAPAAGAPAPLSVWQMLLQKPVFGHPYKVCREDIARCFYFGLGAMRSSGGTSAASVQALHEGRKELLALVTEVGAELRVEVDGLASREGDAAADGDAEKKSKKELKQRVETVLYWLMHSVCAGDTECFAEDISPSVVVALLATAHSDAELSALAKGSYSAVGTTARLNIEAASDVESEHLVSVIRTVVTLAKAKVPDAEDTTIVCANPKVRSAALDFLGAFISYHGLQLLQEVGTAEQGAARKAEFVRVRDAAVAALCDEKQEVQEAAMQLLTAMVAFEGDGEDTLDRNQSARDAAMDSSGAEVAAPAAGSLAAMQAKFIDLAAKVSAPKARRRHKKLKANAKAEGADEAALAKLAEEETKIRKRQCKGVLGLSAMVLAFPQTIPAVVPKALTEMAAHLHLSDPGGGANASFTLSKAVVQQAFADFRRSHQDGWEEEFRGCFTREQLEELDDCWSTSKHRQMYA
jgi:hypothetical protein